MKVKFLSALLLVTLVVVLLQPQQCESKAGWVAVAAKALCGYVCKTKCEKRCSNRCKWVCAPACLYVCGKRKRELNTARLETKVSDDPRLNGTFPSSLKAFDKDKDGKISREEFSITAVSHIHPDLGTKEAFTLSDKNGDNYIDCKEFKMAPLRFVKKPSC